MKVLLLHAFPLDKGMWEPQRAALAEHEVIAPRLYGRGQTMHEWASSIAGETHGDLAVVGASMGRSEERRVGKECRSRWSPYH